MVDNIDVSPCKFCLSLSCLILQLSDFLCKCYCFCWLAPPHPQVIYTRQRFLVKGGERRVADIEAFEKKCQIEKVCNDVEKIKLRNVAEDKNAEKKENAECARQAEFRPGT
jgi:hypothetical protein